VNNVVQFPKQVFKGISLTNEKGETVSVEFDPPRAISVYRALAELKRANPR
jgi:hypothetical protein